MKISGSNDRQSVFDTEDTSYELFKSGSVGRAFPGWGGISQRQGMNLPAGEDLNSMGAHSLGNIEFLQIFVDSVFEVARDLGRGESVTAGTIKTLAKQKSVFDSYFTYFNQTLLKFWSDNLIIQSDNRQKIERELGTDFESLLECFEGSGKHLNPYDLGRNGNGLRMKLVMILANLGYSFKEMLELGLGSSISGIALDYHRARRVCAAARFKENAEERNLSVHHISVQPFSKAGTGKATSKEIMDLPSDPNENISAIRTYKGDPIPSTSSLLRRHMALLLSDRRGSRQVNVVILDYSSQANLKKGIGPMSELGALKAEFATPGFPPVTFAKDPGVLLTDGSSRSFLYFQEDFQILAKKYQEQLSDLDSLVRKSPCELVEPVADMTDFLAFVGES